MQYVELATRIFSLMTEHLVECECAYVQQYVRAGLADQHMHVLAAIVKDMDKDALRADTGNPDNIIPCNLFLFNW